EVTKTKLSCNSGGMRLRRPTQVRLCISSSQLSVEQSRATAAEQRFLRPVILAHKLTVRQERRRLGTRKRRRVFLLAPDYFLLRNGKCKIHPADHHLFPGLVSPGNRLGWIGIVGVVLRIVEVRQAMDLRSLGHEKWRALAIGALPVE